MSPHRRRTRVLAGVAGAVALSGLVLSGCGAGQIAQTSHQVAATNGLNTSVGSVDLRDVQIDYPAAPASPTELFPQGGAAPVRATLVNNGATADRLVSVSSPGAASVRVQGDPTMPQGVALVSKGTLPLTPTNSREIQLVAEGLTKPIAAGGIVPMTFVFANAGSVTVDVPTAVPAEGRPGAAPERVEAEHEGGHGGGAEAGGGHGAEPPAGAPAPAPEGGGH